MTANYRIHSAEFLTSVYQLSDLPQEQLPEVAFAGRSNVGKSTLLNSLVERKALAHASKTPGRTQALNFFELRYKELAAPGMQPNGEAAPERRLRLVDLPGYGYAKVPGALRAQWGDLIESYLRSRRQLAAVVLLVDSRREPAAEEQWFTGAALSGKLLVVATKADKLRKNERQRRKAEIAAALNLHPDRLRLTSSLAGKKEGIEALRDEILSLGAADL